HSSMTAADRRGAGTSFFAETEPLGPSPCLRCCVLQQPKVFAISSLLPSAPPRLPSGSLGVSLGIRSTYVGNLGPRRTTHRGRSSRARERRGFPFVITGLAQGSARNDVILIHLAVARVCLRACQGCARGLLGPRR